MRITREEYLGATSQSAHRAHRAYYAQYVEAWVLEAVERNIGRERILKSTDPHFNDIPLRRWDALAAPLARPVPNGSGIHGKMAALGDHPSLAGMVSIYKEAARQIKEAAE